MSYKYSFADNAEYGAEDLNSLVASLVSAGIADPFTDGEAYNASKLNDGVSLIYTEGVVPENVNTLKVTKVSDGVISIAPGLAFFADGSTLRVTETETLSYTANEVNYVYLKQALTEQNRNYPACTTEAPTGDFVLLAEIGADGKITDKRMYAKGKVPGYQSNANVSMTHKVSIHAGDEEKWTGEEQFEIDMGTNNYSKVFLIKHNVSAEKGQMGVYDITAGTYFSPCVYSSSNYRSVVYTDCLAMHNADGCLGKITFSVSGNKLIGTLAWNHAFIGRSIRYYSFDLVLC